MPESEDDNYYPSIIFSFFPSRDTIVSATYLDTIDIIKERRQFLDLENFYDPLNEFIFIEPIDGKKFILRKVNIVYNL